MSILNNVRYAQTWTEVSREQFPEDDLQDIVEIEVVAADWGKSAKITTKSDVMFYGISRDSRELSIGDKLDPKQCWLVHLKRGVDGRTDKLLYMADPL